MGKPILRFKVNQQSSEVGGKFYGLIEDVPVTPENSILQICEFKKITAFAPDQVLRLVEDVCDGAAQLVARDGQSRQLSSLLKFSPRVRGTFTSEDSRWTDQRLIVGARLLKDIKLDMDPSKFVMSNVADAGVLGSAAWVNGPTLPISGSTIVPAPSDDPEPGEEPWTVNVNGSKLDSWTAEDTFGALAIDWRMGEGSGTAVVGSETLGIHFSDFAANGFSCSINTVMEPMTLNAVIGDPIGDKEILGLSLVIYHPSEGAEVKRLPLPIA